MTHGALPSRGGTLVAGKFVPSDTAGALIQGAFFMCPFKFEHRIKLPDGRHIEVVGTLGNKLEQGLDDIYEVFMFMGELRKMERVEVDWSRSAFRGGRYSTLETSKGLLDIMYANESGEDQDEILFRDTRNAKPIEGSWSLDGGELETVKRLGLV